MLRGPALATIAFLLAVLHSSAIDAAVWRVPLKRHAAPSPVAASDLHAEAKHSSVWTPAFPNDASHAAEHVDFTFFSRGVYSAEIVVGSPAQPISLSLSLGATDNLVLNHKVGSHAYYDHTKSSTYQVNGTRISLYEGTSYAMQGFVSSDQITIPGGNGGLQIHGLSFVELESPDSFFKMFPPHFDGTIGLGPGVQNATGTPSIMRSMITQGLLDKPIVGVHVDNKADHLTFGGIDAQYKDSDITYFTEAREEKLGWWLPPIGFVVNGKRVIVGKKGRTTINEGLEIIGGPPDQVKVLADLVGASSMDSIPCDTPGPDITITVGAFEVTLTKAEYAIHVSGVGVCMFAFFSVPDATSWTLGRPFVERVYMVLDYGKTESDVRLGLAQLKPE